MTEPQEEANAFYNIMKKLTLTIFLILLILICFCFSSCIRTPEERQDKRSERRHDKAIKRVAYLLKKYPDIIKDTTTSDTTTEKNEFIGNLSNVVDSSSFYYLLSKYCDAKNSTKMLPGDSIIVYQEKIIRKTIYKECENLHNGTYILKDQNGDTATVTIKGREIKVVTNDKIITNTTAKKILCPDCSLTLWQDILENGIKWLCFFVTGGIVFMVLFRGRR